MIGICLGDTDEVGCVACWKKTVKMMEENDRMTAANAAESLGEYCDRTASRFRRVGHGDTRLPRRSWSQL